MMGLELRKARERAGITQEEPSFRAGLSRPYISQLERDLKSPTIDTLFRICDALDVSAADVVRRADAARRRKAGSRGAVSGHCKSPDPDGLTSEPSSCSFCPRSFSSSRNGRSP